MSVQHTAVVGAGTMGNGIVPTPTTAVCCTDMRSESDCERCDRRIRIAKRLRVCRARATNFEWELDRSGTEAADCGKSPVDPGNDG